MIGEYSSINQEIKIKKQIHANTASTQTEKKLKLVLQLLSHPALDANIKDKDELKNEGYEVGKN